MKYKVIGNKDNHMFDIGTIVKMAENDHSDRPLFEDEGGHSYWAYWSDVEPVGLLKWPVRLYRAIIGALFGPESHSKERYKI